MRIDDETLMAYADGELSALETKRVEAAMAEDPALAARVARFRSVRRALRSAYDSVAAEPVPDRLRALLGDVATHEPEEPSVAKPAGAQVVDLDAARGLRGVRFSPPAWAAIAASLIVGLFVGRMVTPDDNLFVGQTGKLYAGGELTRVLDTRLASTPDNMSAETRIGFSFRARGGELCRTFAHGRSDNTVSGLACRDGARWAVRMAVSEPSAGAAYRQAGASAPEVLAAVDDLIDGEPLDAAQERQARDSNWR